MIGNAANIDNIIKRVSIAPTIQTEYNTEYQRRAYQRWTRQEEDHSEPPHLVCIAQFFFLQYYESEVLTVQFCLKTEEFLTRICE